MSVDLKEKLTAISKELEADKAKARAKELEPIYERISEINETKNNLDILKGSLEFKSGVVAGGEDKGKKYGLGMKEYKTDVEQETIKKKNKIEVLMVEDHDVKEYLEKQDIKGADQLLDHPEFTDTTQVKEYRGALERKNNLDVSDKALMKRLALLGITIDEKNFSYESAENLVSEKIKEVDAELLQEELKTPEGREKAIKILSEKFKNDLVKMELSKEKENYELELDNNRGWKIVVSKDKEIFHYWQNIPFPKNFESLSVVYGEELAQDAYKKACQIKLEESFNLFTRNNGNFKSLKEQMKPLDPKEARKAGELMDEFEKVQQDFRQMMREKSEELKKKGIDFSPTRASSYGGSYEEYIQLGHYTGDEKVILSAINSANTFPSQFFSRNHTSYNYIKVQELILKRIADVKRFSEEINKIKTEAEFETFMHGSFGRNVIVSGTRQYSLMSKFHDLQLSAHINGTIFEKFNCSGVNPDGSFSHHETDKNFQELKTMTEECSTYSQA